MLLADLLRRSLLFKTVSFRKRKFECVERAFKIYFSMKDSNSILPDSVSSEVLADQKALERKKRNEAKKEAKALKFMAKKDNKSFQMSIKSSSDDKKSRAVQAVYSVPEDCVPSGEKKNTKGDFPAAYDPVQVESSWYAWWEKQGLFIPKKRRDIVGSDDYFSIVMPPPNVTGYLHIGHALTCSIEDTLVRWNRMKGKATVYVPGCDHAGIATQSVVEKRLMAQENKTRHDYGREKFIEKVFEWKDKYGDLIFSQIRKMGVSADWTKESFTMDKSRYNAVIDAFVKLHNKGIIYRSNRIVNWCPTLKTALSNLEVDTKEISPYTKIGILVKKQKKEYTFGFLDYFSYKLKDSDDKITVATTRLETMLGDVAIAVNPSDPKYKDFIGKVALHTYTGRELPIIADNAVDPEFGTGAVKLTPAHDYNDYEMGLRHNLEQVCIMNETGYISGQNCGQFEGMYRYEARIAIREDLKKKNWYVEQKPYAMSLPICSRSGDVIEPMIKPQWWLSCKPLAKKAREAESSGRIKISPDYAVGDWHRWLESIQDWCISRQLWWGHRVPAYFIKLEGEVHDLHDGDYWVAAKSMEEGKKLAEAKFPGKKFTLEQDEDVLDTWFSSALWPLSTLGWPNNMDLVKKYYPTSILETGWDILFFWVARMVMVCLELHEEIPFKEVLCHSMVRDSQNRKMSKSLGNVIDPLDVINGITLEELHQKIRSGNLPKEETERAIQGQKVSFPNGIARSGADSLRFTLLAYTHGARSMNLNILRVEGYRKWCNKIWNSVKFAHKVLGDTRNLKKIEDIPVDKLDLVNRWILKNLNTCIDVTNRSLEEYNFMSMTTNIHQFWLNKFCDFYLEAIKHRFASENSDMIEVTKATLLHVVTEGLKLLHPAMPYITEELYQRLYPHLDDPQDSIMVQRYPEASEKFIGLQTLEFDTIVSIVQNCRSFLQDKKPKIVELYLVCLGTAENFKFAIESKDILKSMISKKLSDIKLLDNSVVKSTLSKSSEPIFVVVGLEIVIYYED